MVGVEGRNPMSGETGKRNARVVRLKKRLGGLLRRLGWQHKFLSLRKPGYAKLAGEGLEIGAFEHPAKVPRRCRVRYADVITPAQAAELFPEIDARRLVTPDYLLDLDAEGLRPIPSVSLDFVIACHVIEHVANPGRFIGELTRVVRIGGWLVIAAPDRDCTFDRRRALTPLDRLEGFYRQGRAPVGPEDYREMVECVHPELQRAPPEVIAEKLNGFFRRREHLSVWTAPAFREFLLAAFGWNRVEMEPLYEVMPDRNRFEYFGVWKRRG